MKYSELNLAHRMHIKSQIHSEVHYEWQDQHVIDDFAGALPPFRRTKEDDKIRHLVWDLEKYYRSYNVFKTEPAAFLESLRDRIAEILKLQPDWDGLDLYAVEQYLKMHRFCLVSGEGGIGKSFFVMELEEALSKRDIPHLCIYGKIEKDIKRIDCSEIAAEDHFVFVVDALNEMSYQGQLELLKQVKSLKAHSRCRVIITYRSFRVPQEILEQYKALAEYEYEFQGVSFESALDCLTRLEIPNAHMYEDILYSNNPLYLSILAKTLSSPKMANRENNRELQSITSITNIFEQYIKKSLNQKSWLKTKDVAEWMYQNNSKVISLPEIENLVDNGRQFFEEMRQMGFMDSYHASRVEYCYFSMETLSDYLVARTLMSKLPKDDIEGQIALIKQKNESFSSFEEAFILILFDRFTPDYKHIRYLMEQTGLWDVFRKETLLKVVFASENIKPFQEVCGLVDPLSCFEIFAGYTNQPFNCTNYLNDLLWNKESQLRLSAILEGKHFHAEVLKRLKNILYTLNTVATTSRRIEEAYWFALWCCAAPNENIRKLAMKLLFDVVSSYAEYRDVTISVYPRICDHYIQEAIVLVLSKFPGDNTIRDFFYQLIDDPNFLLARSLKRIAEYAGTPYGYITWNKQNVRNDEYEVPRVIESLTSHIDLAEKYLLPFRWWGRTRIEMHNTFLDVDKKEIAGWNEVLNQRFICVTQNSDCCGSMNFAQKAEALLGREYFNKEMSADFFYRALAKVANELLHTYPVRMKEERYIYGELTASLVRKCFDIAKDITLGSFMCNYYANQFGTHNTAQDSLGYEVYDPLEREENYPITTPLPNFRSDVEDMNDIVASCIELPYDKNIEWANDLELTRKNLAALQTPFVYQNKEWIMIAGNVKWREDDGRHNTLWEDDYLLWCCTSPDATILGDGNDRYLTIELNDYNGSMSEYVSISDKPHLCKQVPPLSSNTFDILDESGLVLPPAELIRDLNLTVNTRNMTWHNASNEIVLICSNVKYAYFKSIAGRTIFMRKDMYDEYVKTHTLKFFAFTERFHPETGYSEETSKHFEIEGGKIQREFINYGFNTETEQQEKLNECTNCPYGFYVSPEDMKNALHEFLMAFEGGVEH